MLNQDVPADTRGLLCAIAGLLKAINKIRETITVVIVRVSRDHLASTVNGELQGSCFG
jgi:hypothetical protein